ncbi:B12-binding domain-containing radical SAM protein [Arsukibacterium indicum]|uniref:Radical SAM protein n=1 Tax=Arsukibacterium indicum TaxID=2848612 RepID=A0ABS6MH35_9GAMM|nr:radical SAM protein [Arsukibacterium indicum]MBV2128121.1 radical SAM protein [Arsukibacterium indicum]
MVDCRLSLNDIVEFAGADDLYLNDQFIIMQRGGQLMLSQISGVAKPFLVHELDLLLLALFIDNHDKVSVCHAFVSDAVVQKKVPQIKAEAVFNRIRQLQQAGILVNEPGNNPNGNCWLSVAKLMPGELVSELSAAEQKTEIPEALCVSIHFAAIITPEGFAAWSAQHQQYISLPVASLLLLLAFADGKKQAEVVAAKTDFFDSVGQPEQIITKLYEQGLLLRQKRIVHSNVDDIPVFKPAASKPGVATSWQQLDADGRIPVYFVPHMENHLPLALGVLFSALQHYQDGVLLQRFVLIPINFLNPNDLLNGPYRKFGPGVWLFSNYMWSVDLNLQISQTVKQHNSTNLTIHGGPSTPDYPQACKDFMQRHRSVDISVHGEGEVAIAEIFETISKNDNGALGFDEFALTNVTGISFRNALSQSIVHTAGRTRMKEVDVIPSPYLSGYFDGYGGRVEAAIIETNRGCPYGCTFCDWGSATNQKVRKFDMERVRQEIDWIGQNNIKVMWIADANFGMYERDIDIARHIVAVKQQFGFPHEVVVNYTKNSTLKLVEIIKIFTDGGIISQGIISIQTTDEDTLDVINRKNIRTERYDELTQIFDDLKLPLSTDLMIGLPGITVAAFDNDLQRYIDMDVSVKAYPTQLLPNSPMADPAYIEKHQIKVDENNFLISSFSYTEQDLAEMKAMYQMYVMADGYSLLRYIMRYLQWEHGISAITFLRDLLRQVTDDPNRFPQISWAVRFFNNDKTMPGGWAGFYQQIAMFIEQHYQLSDSSALATVFRVNLLSMPDDSLSYPLTAQLQHDFKRYFKEYKQLQKPLASYPPATFEVADPNSMVSVDMNYLQYDTHQFFWELHSAVSRPKSVSDFAAA